MERGRFPANGQWSGVNTYWRAIDKSFQFNKEKRDEFLIREKFRALSALKDNKHAIAKVGNTEKSGTRENMMAMFFRRNKRVDRYHWHRRGRKLPTPTKKY